MSYDKKTSLYKYRYTITNDRSARIPLDWFGILINTAPTSSMTPANWDPGEFTALNSMPYRFTWSTSTVTGEAGKKVTGDGTLVAPTYALKPGSSLSGFEITSPQPPGVVQFFAQGFTQPPSSMPTATDDEAVLNCPGWDFNNAQLLTQVTGVTTGPLDSGTVSVRLRARGEKGIGPHSPINPKQPGGKLAILVLSSRAFDARQIDLSSIMFGPAFAAPVSTKLVGVRDDDDQDQEREEWERVSPSDHSHSDHDKTPAKQNLLLVFDVASLDVQCHLDQSLFLRGATTAGQKIVGGVSAKVVGCKPGEIGTHKRHKIPHQWWPQKARSPQRLLEGVRRVQGADEGH